VRRRRVAVFAPSFARSLDHMSQTRQFRGAPRKQAASALPACDVIQILQRHTLAARGGDAKLYVSNSGAIRRGNRSRDWSRTMTPHFAVPSTFRFGSVFGCRREVAASRLKLCLDR